MTLRINNNVSALNTHRNVVTNSLAQAKNLEKLSSGLEKRSQCSEDDYSAGDSNDNEDEDEDEKDTPVKKANLNDVLARLIPEIALLSGCNGDLGQALEIVLKEGSPQRQAFNEFLIQLYK